MKFHKFNKNKDKRIKKLGIDEDNSEPVTRIGGHEWIVYSSKQGTRNYQQDCAAIPSEELQLLSDRNICVLSDGMGGMQGGELASKICAETILVDYYSIDNCNNPIEFLYDEIDKVDRLVCELTDEEGNPMESGATLLSVIIEEDKFYWASVGDSRIYLFRDEELSTLTRDHSYFLELMEKVDDGLITLQEAEDDKDKDALISYIGMNGVKLADTSEKAISLEDGDIILLCSDGLYKSLEDDEIKDVFMQFGGNLNLAANILTERAVDKRPLGQDNTTVILIKYIQKERGEEL